MAMSRSSEVSLRVVVTCAVAAAMWAVPGTAMATDGHDARMSPRGPATSDSHRAAQPGEMIQFFKVSSEPVSAEEVAQYEVVKVRGPRVSECMCDVDCADGNPCTIDTCNFNEGTGEGTCEQAFADDGRDCDDSTGEAWVSGTDASYCFVGACGTGANEGLCMADQGGTPCDDGETCSEALDVCQDNGCLGSGSCDDGVYCNGAETCDGDNVCQRGTDPCPTSPCDEDLGECGDEWEGRCCYGGADNIDTCNDTFTKADCDAQSGFWEAGYTCDNGGCPQYTSLAPPADQDGLYNYGLSITERPCTTFYRVGDDYTLANASQYMVVESFSVVGGVECTGDGTIYFEWWDSTVSPPVLVRTSFYEVDCPDDAGNTRLSLIPGATFTIPPTGYLTMRAGVGETATLLSTDVAIVGDNDNTLLWVNEDPNDSFYDDPPEDVLSLRVRGFRDGSAGGCLLRPGEWYLLGRDRVDLRGRRWLVLPGYDRPAHAVRSEPVRPGCLLRGG